MSIAMVHGDLSDELQNIRNQIQALQSRAASLEQRIHAEMHSHRPGWPIQRITLHQSPGE